MDLNVIDKIGLLAETSWEVCNKIGGIYTVLSTKAVELKKFFQDRLVFIGPDFPDSQHSDNYFRERKSLLKNFSGKKLPHGLKVRCGRWNIPGSPLVVLVDFKPVFTLLNDIYGEMWETFHVDSLHAYGDYDESCAFAVASAIVIGELAAHLNVPESHTVAHFNEWTTGMGLLYAKLRYPEIKTIFTTHATTVGRSISGNGKDLYTYFDKYYGDQMAEELNVQSKHSVEKNAALNADCFTTVSEVTARECRQFFGKYPDVVTPNGFEPSFVPGSDKWHRLRKAGRERILRIASLLSSTPVNDATMIVATSGRNEFRNKGLDLFIDSLGRLATKLEKGQKVLALILVPAWVKQPSGDLIIDLDFGGWIKPDPDYLTHRLNNEESDAVACKIRQVKNYLADCGLQENVQFMFVPSYLDGNDGIVNISYYDLLPAIDISVFGSYYEPWGYTPLESIAFGIPTITTDKAGFGKWVSEIKADSLDKGGVEVVKREDNTYGHNVEEISDILLHFAYLSPEKKAEIRNSSRVTAGKAEWKFFISKYIEAFQIAFDSNKN